MKRNPMSGFALAAAFMAAAFASTVHAQGRLSLSERVARVEQQLQGQGSGQSTVELLNRIDALQSEVQSLRGVVEQQSFEIETLKKTVRDRYVDLDSRMARIEGGAPRAAIDPNAPTGALTPPPSNLQNTPPQPTQPGQLAMEEPVVEPRPADPAETAGRDSGFGPSAPNPEAVAGPAPSTAIPATGSADPVLADPASEKAAYDDAFAALRDGRYAESARRFQTFLEQYPNGDLTDNALYWLGESYYVTQNYRIALDTFNKLLSSYPQSSKAPDALLKTGYSHYELREWPQAERALEDVVGRYPDTTVARLAQGRLRALKLEGQR